MGLLRSIPLFERVGLMWWLVLLANPFSRPFLFYAPLPPFGLGELEASETTGTLALFGLGGLSMVNALGAAWVVVRALRLVDVHRTPWSIASWTIFIGWFAVLSWSVIAQLVWSVFGLPTVTDVFANLIGILWLSLFTTPAAAFTLLWKATWVIWPLAAATVVLFRRETPPPPKLDFLGRPVPAAD